MNFSDATHNFLRKFSINTEGKGTSQKGSAGKILGFSGLESARVTEKESPMQVKKYLMQ